MWLIALTGGSAVGLALRLAFFFCGALASRTIGHLSSAIVPTSDAVDPVYTRALLRSLAEIQLQGLAIAGPPGDWLHATWPALFAESARAHLAPIRIAVQPGSPVLARLLAAAIAHAGVLGVGLALWVGYIPVVVVLVLRGRPGRTIAAGTALAVVVGSAVCASAVRHDVVAAAPSPVTVESVRPSTTFDRWFAEGWPSPSRTEGPSHVDIVGADYHYQYIVNGQRTLIKGMGLNTQYSQHLTSAERTLQLDSDMESLHALGVIPFSAGIQLSSTTSCWRRRRNTASVWSCRSISIRRPTIPIRGYDRSCVTRPWHGWRAIETTPRCVCGVSATRCCTRSFIPPGWGHRNRNVSAMPRRSVTGWSRPLTRFTPPIPIIR